MAPMAPMAPAVRGVTFDLDDTLWSGHAVLQRASAAFHSLVAARAPAAAARFPPAAFYREMARFQRELPARAHDYTFLRKHTLRFCLRAAAAEGLEGLEGLESGGASESESKEQEGEGGEDARRLRALVADDAQVEALVEDAFRAFLLPRSRPEFFEGALEMLAALESELARADGDAAAEAPARLGAVTNGNCELAELPADFQRCVRFAVSAESAGCAKPRREIFDAAAARFPSGVRRDQLVHVGDDYACDVTGAKRAGMRAVWVNAAWRGPDVMRARPGGVLEPVDPQEREATEREEGEREEGEREESERFPEADAIVRRVSGVLAVVARWNRESRAADGQ